jgi:hypothetical protein
MKMLQAISLIPLLVYATAFAEEITVAQPIFPEAPPQEDFDFVPPVAIGDLPPINERVLHMKSDRKQTNRTSTNVTLAKDGKIIITPITSQAQ